MDLSAISAFAAAAAALVAATVAGLQFYVGRKQAEAALLSAKAAMTSAQNTGRHTVAEFRQHWIDNVRDTLCEYHAILMAMDDGTPVSSEDNRQLSALGTKLELLLNPEEPDSLALLRLTEEIQESATLAEREAKDPEMVKLAHKVLKTEWVRIKTELQ